MFKDIIAFWVSISYHIYHIYKFLFKKVQLSIILCGLIFQHWKYPKRFLICWVTERSMNSSYSSVPNRITDRRIQDKKGLEEDVARW